ncbi:MAG: phosphoadenosine phosphosulfate reductase [Microbacteriaceae bacterium]|nr:phosphoadenosine phosphosulfate reductase [Microbacteriaceae bacterium]
MTDRFISYGGGVQSTALIVLAVQGRIPKVDAALFCNTGDDSEHPATLRFVREVMMPYASSHGLPIHEIQRVTKGKSQTLWDRMMNHERDSLSEPIPVYGWKGAPMSRACTVDHKILVLKRWIKQNCVTLPAQTLVGISVDEIERAKLGESDYEIRTYPLLDLGMTRADCAAVIREAGLPVPPKSSCFFCPFHSLLTWSELRRDEPELFEKAAQLEDVLIQRRLNRNQPPVHLTRKQLPLREAIPIAQDSLFHSDEMEGQCDGGVCFV